MYIKYLWTVSEVPQIINNFSVFKQCWLLLFRLFNECYLQQKYLANIDSIINIMFTKRELNFFIFSG